MRKLLYIILLSLSFTSLFVACNNDLDFTTNANDVLSFSTDTISFDTVFTTVGSSTREFKVYNNNKKALKISSVRIANAEKTGFHINVDGWGGHSSVEDIELNGKDSLSIFVEVNVNPTDKDNPILINDSIIFITNGVTQIVTLIAYGQDVYIWRGKTIDRDTLLTGQKPFLIYDSLVVAPGATLSVDQGVNFYFHDKANMLVKGCIKAKGTWDDPVVFRGDRSDELLSGLSYDLVPGQWGGIRLSSDSYDNEFDHVYIRNGTYGILSDSSDVTRLKIQLKNSVVHNVTGNLISGINYQIQAENCRLSNAGGAIVKLLGGNGRFVQCTMANYMSLSARNSASLIIKNYNVFGDNQVVLYPVEEATFLNCIIYGSWASSSSGEIVLDNEYKNTAVPAPFNHYFDYCLLGTNGEDDADFVATLWNKNPDFRYLNKKNDYKYDFRLDSISTARDYGNKNTGYQYPYDITGKSRTQDAGPDLGCYEY
ncbi:MAG: hypothetical protein FWF54_06500 [Candidatus Azobacteroides sp.]|nr:hypothetical protein [Candidatus Azobacteroides sp.]